MIIKAWNLKNIAELKTLLGQMEQLNWEGNGMQDMNIKAVDNWVERVCFVTEKDNGIIEIFDENNSGSPYFKGFMKNKNLIE
jgi:hypothetical protein